MRPTEHAKNGLVLCFIALAIQTDLWCRQQGEACQVMQDEISFILWAQLPEPLTPFFLLTA